MTVDLHIHTTASDGRLTPQEVICLAEQAGLRYIAITDHDTVAAYEQLAAVQLPAANLTIIPGIECSTDTLRHEVHILGYYIDIANEQFQNQLAVILADRLKRSHLIVAKLAKLGYPLSHDRVLEIAGQAQAVGRPHIAKALVEAGYFPSVSAAFAQVLDKNAPAYVPHYKLTPVQVIHLINQAGGIAVLAHPGLVGDDTLVIDLINAGIQGLEVYHPAHEQTATQRYLDIAKRYKLTITGGSDFHAIPGRYPEKLGMFTVSAAMVDFCQGNTFT